jgi:phosphoribosylanthranilate isomerase
MKTKVKICGLTRAEDVSVALSHGADFLGFIIDAKSPRKLSIVEAQPLFEMSQSRAHRVAVTVNPDRDLLQRIAKTLKPDYVQFHGDETVQSLAEIAKRFDFKIIKAFPITSDEDMKSAGEYAGVVDLILYDAKPPNGSDIRGGHGIAIDWDIIRKAPRPKLYALAGGLNPENVTHALAATQAPIIDVSSGVETEPGVKDAKKIEAIIDAAKLS